MIFAKVQVNGLCAVCTCRRVIPVGLIGGVVEFEFTDPMWDGYTKHVVFRGVGTKTDILNGNIAVIPQEVIARKGVKLKVGIYGTDADKTVGIPTFWADLGVVMDAADPNGDPATDPQLPIWAQLEKKIRDLEEHGIAVDADSIEQAVKDYLKENPPTPGLTEVPVATDEILGGVKVGDNLGITEDGVLSVKTTGAVEETDLRPITSQAVYSEFGKIVALLNTI